MNVAKDNFSQRPANLKLPPNYQANSEYFNVNLSNDRPGFRSPGPPSNEQPNQNFFRQQPRARHFNEITSESDHNIHWLFSISSKIFTIRFRK